MSATPLQQLASIPPTSLADRAYADLAEAIVNGSLPPGTPLTTVALAARLGISRTPIAEALTRLDADGLVEWTATRQARVARFGADDVREIYELRAILEPRAAAGAATHMPAELRAALRGEAAALARRTQRDWDAQALAWDQRLHDAIATHCGNRRLAADVLRYRRLVRALCRFSGSHENLAAAFAEHLEVLAAIAAGDGAAAALAMERHVRQRLVAVQATIESGTGPVVAGADR